MVFLVFWQSIRIRGVRNLGYISHLKVVDIRRWSIPKEGFYAVRNVIIIGVCFLLFNGNNKSSTNHLVLCDFGAAEDALGADPASGCR